MKKLDNLQMEMIQAGWHWRCWLGVGLLAIGLATGVGIVVEAIVVGAAAVGGASVAGGVALLNSKSCD